MALDGISIIAFNGITPFYICFAKANNICFISPVFHISSRVKSCIGNAI